MDISKPVESYGATLSAAPAFWQVDMLWVLLASGHQTGGRYCLLWQLCPQGSGPGPHTHDQDEEFYVLDGDVTFRAGNQTLQAAAGSFLFIPRATVHSFRVESERAQLLNSYTPAGFERLITELSLPAQTRTVPPKGLPPAVTDPQHIMTVMAQAGMHWVDEPDVLRPPVGRSEDSSQARDLYGRPLTR
jgi:mannose-6-phosphate isomerase-like protein (cupin superfamily)